MHSSTPDAVEYSPTGHAVHLVPADDTGDIDDDEPLASVVTIDPAAHVSHAVDACLPLYCPAPHGRHPLLLLFEPFTAPYLPASQLSH